MRYRYPAPARRKRASKKCELSLVKLLEKHGWRAVRIPTSASGNVKLPDVFAVRGKVIAAFEVKLAEKGRVYVSARQIKKLFDFLQLFEDLDCERVAVVAVRFKRRFWVFKRVEKIGDVRVDENELPDFNPY